MAKSLSEIYQKQQEWRAKKRAERTSLGLCNRCGSPAPKNRKICNACNTRGKQQHKNTYNAKMLQIIDYLGGKCIDCKQTFLPCVYDIHHTNSVEKSYQISGNKVFLPWEELKIELDKCVLLCSNCHRIRHNKEGYYNPNEQQQV